MVTRSKLKPKIKKIPDCQTCGACCVSNYDYGYHAGIEPDDYERLSSYYKRHNVIDALFFDKKLATKVRSDGTVVCVAFRGKIGKKCSCAIYPNRPSICREFSPGNMYCREARKQEKIESR